MAQKYDYSQVPIPTGKQPETYTFLERRGEILRMMAEAGHPKAVSLTSLAKRYAVSVSQIHHDVNAIREQIMARVGNDAEFIIHMVFQKAIRRGISSDNIKDNMDAAKLAGQWAEFLFNSGIKKKAATAISIRDDFRDALNEELPDVGDGQKRIA